MTSIQYISDIHLEFYNYAKIIKIANKIIPIAKILILAGDIGKPVSRIKKNKWKINRCFEYFLKLLSIKFEQIFVITGNHEYYNNLNVSIIEINKIMKDICHQIPNIKFLDNNYYDYNGIRFIGSTLWSKIDENTTIKINDLSNIPNMTIEKYNNLHYNSLEFLDTILSESQKLSIPCIIISHHLPLLELANTSINTINTIDNISSSLTQWFASDLTELTDNYGNIIKSWIYGHTHYKSVKHIKNIIFAANPIGYPHEMTDQKFNKTLLI